MIGKKLWKEDILHLVLLLSLLRIDRNSELGYGAPLIEVGSSGRTTPVTWSRNIYDYEVSPKNYESMLSNYERWVFHDLNLLGRYSPVFQRDVTAYVGLTPDERSVRGASINDDPTVRDDLSVLDDLIAPNDPSELLNDLSAIRFDPVDHSSSPPRRQSDLIERFEDIELSDSQVESTEVPDSFALEFNHVDPYEVSFSLSELGSPRDWREEFPDVEEVEVKEEVEEEASEHQDPGSDLTPEDMELIEVLWKQDVDMGFSLEDFQEAAAQAAVDQAEGAELAEKPSNPSQQQVVVKKESPDKPCDKDSDDNNNEEVDLWSGLSYTIDLETGEYILKREVESPPPETPENSPGAGLEENFSLEEALQLVGINDDVSFESENEEVSKTVEKEDEEELPEVPNQLSLDDQLKVLQDMLQAPPPPPAYYHRALQGHQNAAGGISTVPQHGGYMSSNNVASPIPPSQTRSSYGRTSQEQRWQDLANLLGVQSHQDYHHHYQTNHYPPPLSGPASSAKMPPENNNLYPMGTMGGNTMNLMATNGSEPMASEPTQTTFKMETPNNMMYYQNGSDPNQNQDGFINSILSEDDILMDMAMNDGIYTMRMLEGSAGAADSDSAVSSMGSERVPSLTSDTDWMETNSDSGHTPADHFMAASTDLHSKLRWFDYNYCRQHSGEQGGGNSHRMPPVAQKKYHLFGKRLFSEQPSGNSGPAVPTGSGSSPGSGSTSGAGTSTNLRNSLDAKFDYNGVGVATPSLQPVYEHPSSPLDMVKPPPQEVKYSCSLEFARQNHCSGVRMSPSEAAVHNHSYPLPPDLPPGHLGILQRPLTRDKRTDLRDELDDDEEVCLVGKRGLEDISISRDERRARALNIPISVHDIINLPMDEFNERLSKFDLSETQLSLIRDIRRRGKNKVAAQNCRKRKLDQILSLADEVKMFREKKQRLLMERDSLLQERMRVKSTVAQLFRHIFQSLRDEDGNSYSPHEWSLEEALDGSIVLVPRGASDLTTLRHHLPSNSTRSEDRDLHQPSTSKKELDPRKHLP